MSRQGPGPALLVLFLLIQIQLVVVQSLAPSAGAYTDDRTTVPPVLPCQPDQASALLRLKRSFSATNESMATFRSWKASTDCCRRWEGVRCGHGDGRVTSLDLGGRSLESGGLDPALFHLTSLEYLDLAYNCFNVSQLPSNGFEHLTKLTHLNLSSCSFSGEIPTAVGLLTNLVSLDLSTTIEIVELDGDGYMVDMLANSDARLLLPNFESLISNLTNLRELHLGYVDLSDNGVEWCNLIAKSSPKLEVLSLPFCQLSGPICTSLSRLRSLAVIDLHYNKLSGSIPDFMTNFSNLSVLQLRHNKFEGWISSAIFQLKKLVTIDLYRNPSISGYLPEFSASNVLENLIVGRTNFSGTIPTSIGNLKWLKKLDLSEAGFSGELPWSISKLKSLNQLAISGIDIKGSIPSWVANLTSLTDLEFSYCGLSGSIPAFLGDLRKLERLVLCRCYFSGEIPPHISNLTQLQTLLLYSNNLVGIMELASLRKFPHLLNLDLSQNSLTVVDGEYNSSFSSLPKIELISLSGCNMSKFPNFLRNQDEIVSLDLSYNQFHGAIPQWLWESDHFFILDLSNNKFTSVGHEPFLPPQIDIFDLSNNMFEGPIPIPYGFTTMLNYTNNRFSSVSSNFSSHLSNVTLFMASRNSLHGKISPSFCAASIQILDLSYNNLSGSIPPCLMENADIMQSLNLKANKLLGELPNNINKGCSLEALDFSGHEIVGRLPRSLVACKNLKVIDVGNNKIIDSFPCWMSTLRGLEVLILKSNNFFGHVSQSLVGERSTCVFPSARIVDLSSNNFYGPLPQDEWFRNLTSMILRDSNAALFMAHGLPQFSRILRTYGYTVTMTYKGQDITFQIFRTLVLIDVSNNAFHGSIPKAIGELVLLNGLNMSHNSLVGPIPAQLGRLKQMEALDLSSNKLSGVIPRELASLNFLETLNLSYNKLEGRIPESTQFSTFSNSSFLGNDGLCGPPLSKGCNNMTSLNVILSKKNSADIMLFLFSGLGFGLGFAIAIVVTWGIPIRKWSPVIQRALSKQNLCIIFVIRTILYIVAN